MASVTPHQLMSQSKTSHFSPHSTAKNNDKITISGRMVSSGISDVAFTVHSEKTHLKIMIIIIIIIMNKSQETTVFSGHQKLTSAMKLRPE